MKTEKDYSYFNQFKSGLFIGSVIMMTLVLSGVFLYYYMIPERIILPDTENYSFYVYGDGANGGNSEILDYEVSDSIIRIHFVLEEGFVSPYVGVAISSSDGKPMDLSRYNELKIGVEGENISRINITLFTAPGLFEESDDEIIFQSQTVIQSSLQTLTIPLENFVIPDWWMEQHFLSGKQRESSGFNAVRNLNIGSAFDKDNDNEMILRVHHISFSRNNVPLMLWLGGVEIGFILVMMLITYLINLKPRSNKRIVIEYQPVEINEIPVSEGYVSYINKHFQDSDLSLEQVSQETGIPQRQISHSLQEDYDCNFKSFVNRIRISEARRLLLETDLNIGEVAYKVGFNNQSHFNRVFRKEVKINPSAFRNAHKE